MALRIIEVVLRQDLRERVADLPDDLQIIEQWMHPLDSELVALRLLVESDRTDTILHELETRLRPSSFRRVVIQDVAAILPEPPIVKPEPDKSPTKEEIPPARVACIELVQELTDASKTNRIYLLTVSLSTIVAALGLVQNSAAVVIGAMVIAPMLAPNMALSLSATLAIPSLARMSLRTGLVGLALAFGLSVLAGLILHVDPGAAEIASRTRISLADILLALCAGSAGALAFTSGVAASLVGVMVAVALLPPLVVAGLLLAQGDWVGSYHALLLLLTNVVCINISGILVFLLQGIRPRFYWAQQQARHMVRMSLAVWTGLLVLLAGLILLTQ